MKQKSMDTPWVWFGYGANYQRQLGHRLDSPPELTSRLHYAFGIKTSVKKKHAEFQCSEDMLQVGVFMAISKNPHKCISSKFQISRILEQNQCLWFQKTHH